MVAIPKRLSSTQLDLSHLNREVQAIDIETQNYLRAVRAELDGLQATVVSIQAQLTIDGADIDTLQVQLAAAQASIAALQAQVDALLIPIFATNTGAAYTNATTTFTNLPGGAFSLDVGTYVFFYHASYFASGAAVSSKYRFSYSGAASSQSLTLDIEVLATGDTTNLQTTALATSLTGPANAPLAGNPGALKLFGFIVTTSSGTLNLQAAANVAGTLTVRSGSFGVCGQV